MSFFCPCLSWLRIDQGPLHVQQDEQLDSPTATSQNEKKNYQVVRLSGDADSEPVHFSVLGSKEESEKSTESCQSPLMNLILNTKNAITNKIQQGKEIATDSITTAYNNSAIMERFENFGDRIGTGLLPERHHREAECVICLVEFSEGNPKMLTLCGCGEHRANFHYPCLLLYLQKKKQCPVCNQELFYQENCII